MSKSSGAPKLLSSFLLGNRRGAPSRHKAPLPYLCLHLRTAGKPLHWLRVRFRRMRTNIQHLLRAYLALINPLTSSRSPAERSISFNHAVTAAWSVLNRPPRRAVSVSLTANLKASSLFELSQGNDMNHPPQYQRWQSFCSKFRWVRAYPADLQ